MNPVSKMKALCTVLLALLTCVSCLSGWAAEPSSKTASSAEMRSLDEQVQEIKSDVLSIAAELNQLEERLIYPSNTQLAIFVAFDEGETFRLDAVQIQINGELAAHHIYSFKELEALTEGGVQRIYMGNLSTGSHEMDVSVIGKQGDKAYTAAQSFTFDKGIDPSLLGITLAVPDSGKAAIQLQDW